MNRKTVFSSKHLEIRKSFEVIVVGSGESAKLKRGTFISIIGGEEGSLVPVIKSVKRGIDVATQKTFAARVNDILNNCQPVVYDKKVSS